MGCLRCGGQTAEGDVFCEHCLSVMAQYPVKPGTPILLPASRPAAVKKPGKAIPTAKEQLQRMRKKNRRLRRAVIILSAALLLCGCALLYAVRKKLPSGLNYKVVEKAPTETVLPTEN